MDTAYTPRHSTDAVHISSGTAPQKPQVVFFGSGPVAARSLELLAEHCDIEAVITKPQPPHHKEPFPVLQIAERLGLKTFTPYGKKELSELFADRPVSSQLGIVIDYGFIINQDVIDYFPLGIINSHFSLLPEWRGADPITFSILSGQKETGVSLMLITAGLDEGPLLAQGICDIPPDATTPQLTEALIGLSNGLLQKMIPEYIAGKAVSAPQEAVALPGHDQVTYSRKLTKEDGLLDFSKPAVVLEREVRAFLEWPRSRTILGGVPVTITKAHVEPKNSIQIGTIWLEDKRFGFYCGQNSLEIDRIIPAGKKEMSAEAFLAGYRQLLAP
ncbi:MAG TPA: methionyl-tRNA formyltransferase [Candidatus Saccharimonadales bacterium]|nr:methionyl-tRNA formyltransferase [Candidatus Saccharimonadales bacterium]